MNNTVKYSLNKATESDIFDHISGCDIEFVQALIKRVDIIEYSKKIYNKAVRFEAWDDDTLVGLVAAYCNDQARSVAFITSISVLSDWQSKGIAAKLIRQCIDHAEKLGMHCASLQVARGNAAAICLYKKCGFVIDDIGDSMLTMNLILTKG